MIWAVYCVGDLWWTTQSIAITPHTCTPGAKPSATNNYHVFRTHWLLEDISAILKLQFPILFTKWDFRSVYDNALRWMPNCPFNDDLSTLVQVMARCRLAAQCHPQHLTHWGRVTHICIDNLTIIGSDNGLSPGRLYLNQCWNIVNWTVMNKLQWNFNVNSYILIQENAFENVGCEMASILSRPQCVNTLLLFNEYTVPQRCNEVGIPLLPVWAGWHPQRYYSQPCKHVQETGGYWPDAVYVRPILTRFLYIIYAQVYKETTLFPRWSFV